MYNYIYSESLKRAKHNIWILSDLQQANPDYARECLHISMKDYENMGQPADMIWYLGDSVEGNNREHLLKMCDMQEKCPVITASHYSYQRGNRASEHLSKLLPLPANMKIHFYGHSHIGDYDWAKENAYRRIACIDWHDIPQINVSSFEHIRGQACRSVFLHIYEDHSFGIFFRNHDAQAFSECYFPAKENHLSRFLNR